MDGATLRVEDLEEESVQVEGVRPRRGIGDRPDLRLTDPGLNRRELPHRLTVDRVLEGAGDIELDVDRRRAGRADRRDGAGDLRQAHRQQAMRQAQARKMPWMLASKIAGTGSWLVQRQGDRPVCWTTGEY